MNKGLKGRWCSTEGRDPGLFSVCALACGAILSGLFVLPGHAAEIGGAAVYLAFLLAGLLFFPAVEHGKNAAAA